MPLFSQELCIVVLCRTGSFATRVVSKWRTDAQKLARHRHYQKEIMNASLAIVQRGSQSLTIFVDIKYVESLPEVFDFAFGEFPRASRLTGGRIWWPLHCKKMCTTVFDKSWFLMLYAYVRLFIYGPRRRSVCGHCQVLKDGKMTSDRILHCCWFVYLIASTE